MEWIKYLAGIIVSIGLMMLLWWIGRAINNFRKSGLGTFGLKFGEKVSVTATESTTTNTVTVSGNETAQKAMELAHELLERTNAQDRRLEEQAAAIQELKVRLSLLLESEAALKIQIAKEQARAVAAEDRADIAEKKVDALQAELDEVKQELETLKTILISKGVTL